MGKKYNIDIVDKFFSVNDSNDENVDNPIDIQGKSTPKKNPESTPKSTPKRNPESTPKSTPKRNPESTPKKNPESTPKSTPKRNPARENKTSQITLKIKPSLKEIFEETCAEEGESVNGMITELIRLYLKKQKKL